MFLNPFYHTQLGASIVILGVILSSNIIAADGNNLIAADGSNIISAGVIE